MKKKFNAGGVIFVFLWLSLISVILFVPFFQCLSISNRKNPAQKYYSRDALGGFIISYTHSVNKGRVHDFYECENGKLFLDRTDFVSYGAGISEVTENPDSVFFEEDENYSLRGLNRRMKYFYMAVGVIAEHSITIGEEEIFLKEIFAPQTSLKLEIKRVSLFDYINVSFRCKNVSFRP